jgi:hypothetical protein
MRLEIRRQIILGRPIGSIAVLSFIAASAAFTKTSSSSSSSSPPLPHSRDFPSFFARDERRSRAVVLLVKRAGPSSRQYFPNNSYSSRQRPPMQTSEPLRDSWGRSGLGRVEAIDKLSRKPDLLRGFPRQRQDVRVGNFARPQPAPEMRLAPRLFDPCATFLA